MVTYAKAKEGNIFVLTEEGEKVSNICAKYRGSESNRMRYSKSVPESWVKNGYVTEVKDGDV